MTKEKTARLIPNAVQVSTETDKVRCHNLSESCIRLQGVTVYCLSFAIDADNINPHCMMDPINFACVFEMIKGWLT